MKFFPSILLLFLSVFISFKSTSQFGNEWIDYSQKYYSFKIAQDGIYKIDYATLNSAGVPVSSIHPGNFQVYGFEKEQYIFVEDGGDGSFDPGDYILLYAKKNTSWLDSLIYDFPNSVGNKYYPHYNDTITYFLTWNNSTTNRRMIEETDVNFASYTPSPFFLKRRVNTFSNIYSEGYKLTGISYSKFVSGEGWSSNLISAHETINYLDVNIATPYAFTSAGAPNVTGLAVSTGSSNASFTGAGNHHLQLQYGTSNTVLHNVVFTGYQKNNLSINFPASDIVSTSTRIRHQLINDMGAVTDFQSVFFVELTYPHLPNLENTSYYEFISVNSGAGKSYYNLINFNSSQPIAFTLDGHIRKLPVVNMGLTYEVIIPNAPSGSQNVVILDENQIININQLTPVNGTGDFTNFNFINFNDAYIIISHSSLWSAATQYQNYRLSPQGRSFNALLFDVDELNLQFGGGVPKHIMGIRRFIHFAYENAGTKPNHVFLIGKGVREANEGIASGNGMRKGVSAYQSCLIPTFGYPASDNLITYNIAGNGVSPLIPIGRLAAKNVYEVQLYLNKVIEYEIAQDPFSVYNVPSKLWQKEILHFGGGSNAAEQFAFKSYLNSYANTLEGPSFGGNVTSFFKTVSDPIDPVTLYQVNDYINSGVSFMTFFGHATADGFDQNVDNPENWDNQGKYPIVIGNSCLTGNVHEPNDYSVSEKFVIIENKGAIAFISNVKQAFSNGLHIFSSEFFRQVSQLGYGNTIGEHMKNTIDNIQSGSLSFASETVLGQITLHGDPALLTNSHQAPELEVNESSIFVKPDIINLSIDSIDVSVVIYNLGMATTDTFAVELTRTFPNNGGDSLYTQLVNGINYIDTIVFKMPLYANAGFGINSFNVKVDLPSVIAEQYDEFNNNQITKQIFFDLDGIYPVWPYNYAVVPKDTIKLKGSTVNPFAQMLTYRFEIDTTDLFNSPFRKYASTTSLGGVIEINYNQWLNHDTNMPNELILQDSMVYFWRVSVDNPSDYNWIEHSFQYIPGKVGWGQDHFFQFKNNDFLFLNYNREARLRLFDPAFKTINCDVYGNASSFLETAFTLWKINGELQEYNFCTLTPSFLVCVIDPFTLKPWGTRWFNGTEFVNPDKNFGNANDNSGCRNRVEYNFSFYQNNPSQLMAMENMLLNEVPDSFYVLIYTSRFLNYPEWTVHSPQVYDLFQDLGSDSIQTGKSNVPYICYYKKGNTNTFKEVYGQSLTEFITLNDTLWGYDYNGTETSTLIGPAQSWETIYWKQNAMETITADSSRLNIFGVNYYGVEELLMQVTLTELDSIENVASLISANDYPFLRLQYNTQDTLDFTPAQLNSWHVLYTPVPEAALTSTNGFYFTALDSIAEGQKIFFGFDIVNVSDYPMDSLLVKYWIEDNQHNLIPIPYSRQDSLRVGQTFRDTLEIDSKGLQNLNSLWVEVNPYIGNTPLKDQPEKYHFNNIGQIPFYVIRDNIHPILDVTFNGIHILNRDIVNPKSEIIITLKDENEFLLMDSESDTAFFGIYLTDPHGSQKRLYFRNQTGEQLLEWIPADANSKKFKIIYNANLLEDGVYRLLVQGSDKSGNISGDYVYDIEFEVTHKSTITALMNYPNPFSTQTQFVFTLTGSVIPDEFTIQIMTITGKVVREITIHELGDIHIGRNITEYRWDGTDEFGDKLANGIYLYRVITKINGEEVEHRETGADNYITKGFGKMYLIR